MMGSGGSKESKRTNYTRNINGESTGNGLNKVRKVNNTTYNGPAAASNQFTIDNFMAEMRNLNQTFGDGSGFMD